MKIAELNIGLSSKSLGEITPFQVEVELKGFGFEIITSRTVESESKDGKEKCFACKVRLPKDWQSRLARIAEVLEQDCIAVTGFIGHAPYDAFCAELWVSPEKQLSK